MRMSDIMSSLHLAIYPIIALLLFLSVFVGVVLKVASRSRGDELDGAALLPLAHDAGTPNPAESDPLSSEACS